MKDKKLFYLLTGLGILNIILIIFIYSKLPENIPIHWGFNGNVDNWGNKKLIFLFGILPVVIPIGLYLLPRLDPKRNNYSKFSTIYSGFSIWITLFLILLCWLTIGVSLGIFENKIIPIIVSIIIGLALIVFGNYMPRIKQNWFFGTKTPWALSNKNNWMKTQRFSGRVFILLGVLIILNGFIMNKLFFIITIIITIASVCSMYFYSYYLYQKEISDND